MITFHFITVHFNTFKDCKEYIENIESLNLPDKQTFLKIWIVDNNSDEINVSAITEYINTRIFKNYISIHFFTNDKNIGYFRGLNIALSHILHKDIPGQFYLIGNNDIIYDKDILINLVALKLDNDVIVIAPNIQNASGFFENPHERIRIPKKRIFLYDLYFSNYYFGKFIFYLRCILYDHGLKPSRINKKKFEEKNSSYIYSASGSQFILLPQFFKYHSILLEDVFLWAEETLLAHQVYSVSKKIFYAPQVRLFHKGHISTNQIPDKRAYQWKRDSHWITRKYL
jgi:GT2 family glycosyltransferase